MDNPILLVDTWESGGAIDENKLLAEGVSGIIVRLNDMNGGHHMDTNFAAQWEQSKVLPARFPYFVYNPWVSGQANFDWLLAHMPADAKSVAIDVEVLYSGISQTQYAAEVNKCYQLAKAKWKTVIYTGQWFLSYLSSWPAADYWWAQYPYALYPPDVQYLSWTELRTKLLPIVGPSNASYVPGALKLWQCSADRYIMGGCSSPIDINIWFGTMQELLDFAGTGVIDSPPVPDGEEPMGAITYQGGVRVIEGTYSGRDFRAVVVPAAAIASTTLHRSVPANIVENIVGDIVFNWSPFDASGNPNLGLRINGTTIKSYVDFCPFIYWSSKKLYITHPKTVFTSQATAGQGFRYLIQNGSKNAAANTEWNFRAARRVLATNSAGDTIILTTKGVSGQEAGLTLHEVCSLLFSLGLGVTWALDGDSGGSAQDYVRINGEPQVFRGDANAVVSVPVFGVIKLVTPLTGGTVPPPDAVVPVKAVVTMSDGSTFEATSFTKQ